MCHKWKLKISNDFYQANVAATDKTALGKTSDTLVLEKTEKQRVTKPAILAATGTLQSAPFAERPAPPTKPKTKLKSSVKTARIPSAG